MKRRRKGKIPAVPGELGKRLDKKNALLFNTFEFLWESIKEEKFFSHLASLVSLARINQIEDRFF